MPKKKRTEGGDWLPSFPDEGFGVGINYDGHIYAYSMGDRRGAREIPDEEVPGGGAERMARIRRDICPWWGRMAFRVDSLTGEIHLVDLCGQPLSDEDAGAEYANRVRADSNRLLGLDSQGLYLTLEEDDRRGPLPLAEAVSEYCVKPKDYWGRPVGDGIRGPDPDTLQWNPATQCWEPDRANESPSDSERLGRIRGLCLRANAAGRLPLNCVGDTPHVNARDLIAWVADLPDVDVSHSLIAGRTVRMFRAAVQLNPDRFRAAAPEAPEETAEPVTTAATTRDAAGQPSPGERTVLDILKRAQAKGGRMTGQAILAEASEMGTPIEGGLSVVTSSHIPNLRKKGFPVRNDWKITRKAGYYLPHNWREGQ